LIERSYLLSRISVRGEEGLRGAVGGSFRVAGLPAGDDVGDVVLGHLLTLVVEE